MQKLCVYAGTLLSLCLSVSTLHATEPAWWVDRGVIAVDPITSARLAASDYAVVNQGQFKNFVEAAVEELNAKLPGGAGSELNALTSAWNLPDATGTRSDFSAVNIGQAKSVMKFVYDRLMTFGVVDEYPWISSIHEPKDYAMINVGQLKRLMNFQILSIVSLDSDGDGIPDEWEVLQGLDPLVDDTQLDPDGDGLSNIGEYLANRNPAVADGPAAADANKLEVFKSLE